MTELKVNKNSRMRDHAVRFEIEKLQKSISNIEKNIADFDAEYESQVNEIEEEINYDPWFYAAIIICFLWFIYKIFTDRLLIIFSSFIFLLIICGLFFLYKKFLHRDKRLQDIKDEHQHKIEEQEKLIATRRKELAEYEE